MELSIIPKDRRQEQDERHVLEIAQKAKILAKTNPTLQDVLYNVDNEKIPTVQEVLNDVSN